MIFGTYTSRTIRQLADALSPRENWFRLSRRVGDYIDGFFSAPEFTWPPEDHEDPDGKEYG